MRLIVKRKGKNRGASLPVSAPGLNRHLWKCAWINLEMVRAGFAWHYKQYSKDRQLAAAEVAAREARRGLWADKAPAAAVGFQEEEMTIVQS
jgi:hypothetical protein